MEESYTPIAEVPFATISKVQRSPIEERLLLEFMTNRLDIAKTTAENILFRLVSQGLLSITESVDKNGVDRIRVYSAPPENLE